MSLALELHLDDSSAAFDPGARVSGTAVWSAPTPPRGMELRLAWTLQGKWERDLKIVETIPLPHPLATERRPFDLMLPLAPYSFRGMLLTLTWTLTLVALPGEESAHIDIVVAPGRAAIDFVIEGARV
jgi:hypothetical protein